MLYAHKKINNKIIFNKNNYNKYYKFKNMREFINNKIL